MTKIIVAVTGASGAIYARKVLEKLTESDLPSQIAVIVSRHGREVVEYEGESLDTTDPRVVFYDNDDMFAPPASGSADYDAMIIVPCSMGSAGRIAAGVSSDLIGRAADVMLKERRTLVAVVRETPLSTIHLRNLTLLSECGAVVMPASPSFYSHPTDIDAMCDTVIERALKIIGIPCNGFQWNGGR